jgi:ABC-type branched-subunit amino acid transport system ATPase component
MAASPETVAPASPETVAPAPSTTPVLRLEGVAKSFGGRRVVDIGALELGRHGIEGLIGPNGAGKTTLMNLITQKLTLDRGRVLFGAGATEVDLTGLSVDRVARLGVVKTNQVIRDFGGLTIRDSLLLALAAPRYERFWRVGSERRLNREVADEMAWYLDYFGLADPDRFALSAGEKKLVDIIRCLLVRPRVLLMDEPTAGLPDDQTRRVMELMQRKAAGDGLVIVIVEHDLGLIWEICERVHFMADGEVLLAGAPDAIRSSRLVADKYLGTSGG